MYIKRRIEEIIDKTLERMDVKFNKFGYDENAPEMQIKYDIWCNSEEASENVCNKLNSLFGYNIADELGDDVGNGEGEYLVSVALGWLIDEAEEVCKKEDSMIKYYLENSKDTINPVGSYEQDLESLRNENLSGVQ